MFIAEAVFEPEIALVRAFEKFSFLRVERECFDFAPEVQGLYTLKNLD